MAANIVRMDLRPSQLRENDWNPNSMNKREFTLLCEQIEEVGFIDPVTVVEVTEGDERYYRIIGGAHRWAAAKELGLETIPVDVLQGNQWQAEELQKLQTVRLNVLHGEMKPDKFIALYNEMVAKFGREAVARQMGFTKEDGIKKMIKEISKNMKQALPPGMADEFEEQAKDARTVADLNKIIQHLFQEHGDTVKHNFMIFSWAGKEHIYVAMSEETRSAMKKIMKEAKDEGVDINELLAWAIKSAAESIDVEKSGDGVH